jgi:alpha-L-fucosidase
MCPRRSNRLNKVEMKCSVILLVLVCACNSRKSVPPPPLLPVPAENQLAWHKMEMNAFVHFSINTFTDKEWGYGDEDPKVFNPTAFDANQWTSTFKEAGFKGVILTCKHHDGFCLWPSKYTEHSVTNSDWKDGHGDVVRAVAEACKRQGLAFGIYVSPWDRNHQDYGTSMYVEYYRNQLNELFSNYGPFFEMWFDGANGGDGYYGGKREKRSINGATYYDWPQTIDMVRKMEPAIIFFSDAGPVVRWVGNEKGIAGETNWNMISPDTLYAGKGGIETLLNTGSENGTSWIPAEVDVSIRPGWFYHKNEDAKVKTGKQLFEIYLTSVGRGSTLLLNVPPDRRGLIHENDQAALVSFRVMLDSCFRTDLAMKAKANASSTRSGYAEANLNDGRQETFWSTDDPVTTASVEFTLENEALVSFILLQEYIQLGQRVKEFSVESSYGNQWKEIARGTTIGYKRILRVNPIRTNRIRVNFLSARACLAISTVGIY